MRKNENVPFAWAEGDRNLANIWALFDAPRLAKVVFVRGILELKYEKYRISRANLAKSNEIKNVLLNYFLYL